jgi:hypothetical protein
MGVHGRYDRQTPLPALWLLKMRTIAIMPMDTAFEEWTICSHCCVIVIHPQNAACRQSPHDNTELWELLSKHEYWLRIQRREVWLGPRRLIGFCGVTKPCVTVAGSGSPLSS